MTKLDCCSADLPPERSIMFIALCTALTALPPNLFIYTCCPYLCKGLVGACLNSTLLRGQLPKPRRPLAQLNAAV
jgi:hypothetical protein